MQTLSHHGAPHTEQRYDLKPLASISHAPQQLQRRQGLSYPTLEGALNRALPTDSAAGPNHAVHSIAPISSVIGVSSDQYSSLEPWDTPTFVDSEYSALFPGSYHRLSQGPHTFAPAIQDFTDDSMNGHHTDTNTSGSEVLPTEEQIRESKRMQKIARDMLAVKEYDFSIMIPRHISQEHDEFFIVPDPSLAIGIQGIPGHLQLLPRDANYLVDVFFEHAYFYYPVIDRATAELYLMEPQTPQALFLLNIIFMTACKHLARTSDIKRAIRFRERAREMHFYIDAKVRLSRMQGILLGSLVVYGVFKAVIGLAEICGTYNALATTSYTNDADGTYPDLEAASRSIQATKGMIPEAAYQARLWTFWGLYIRDSISRLYFGWPHGMDSMAVTAELPKIEGCVGLGGKEGASRSLLQARAVIGKRRDTSFKRDQVQPEKRHMAHSEDHSTPSTDRASYRNTLPDSDGDEDDEEEENGQSKDGKWARLQAIDEEGDDDPTDQDRGENMRAQLLCGQDSGGGGTARFSVLSPKILEQQSRHDYPIQARQPPSSPSDQLELDLHMERMQLLLDVEEDTTDGGSYARVLFLEEVRLWTLGRRVGLYLAGRSNITAPSACPMPLTGDSVSSSAWSGASSTSATEESAAGAYERTSQWSEQAWLQDYELQSLQTELIAWEEAIPSHLRFRYDVDHANVNHKVNGKMSVLIMSYYTITIMLQSSYLPILQGTSSREFCYQASPARSADPSHSKDVSEALKQSTARPVSRATSPNSETDSATVSNAAKIATAGSAADTERPSSMHVPPHFQTGSTSATSKSQASQGRQYFNTSHKICTELSNVLLHHVELMLDSYPNWCAIQAKVNHAITAALRVSCLNAKLKSNTDAAREEAKAGFKMGSDLFKRLALLPYPLTIRDWPVEEDVKTMMEIEEEFRGMMMTHKEQEAVLPSSSTAIPGSVAVAATTITQADSSGVGGDGDDSKGTASTEVTTTTTVSGTKLAKGEHPHASQERGFGARQHIFGTADEEEYKFEFDQPSNL
ncbi:hypothetical protein BGZ54_003764 [Gamsiella multidivaricata]|nr:hypothetical protein BGZ54_003764 [Gamsiella multidivaricata]